MKISYLWAIMAGISDSEVGKKAVFGTKAVVTTCFNFQITKKAITREDAVLMGLDVPANYTAWPVEFCNTEVDRHNERFTKSVLDVFASQMNGRNFTFNLFHRSDKGIGKTLRNATVEPMNGGFVLKGYIAISDKAKLDDQDILVNEAITDGIYTDVSVEIMGNTEYIADPQGNRGVWEYYIDQERPNRTQFMGAALVAMGAQIGATIVKSIDGNENQSKEKSNSENMNHFFDKLLMGGELVTVKSVENAGKIEIEGLSTVVEKCNAAITAKAESDAKLKAATDETNAIRESLTTDIINLSGALKQEVPTAESLALKSVADLYKSVTELRAKHDGAGDKTTEKEVSTFKNVEY